MSNYTKGEWKIERVPIQSSGGSNTCFKIGPFQACIYDDWRQYQEYGITTLENEANAKLIAAAPDLLEACQQLFFAPHQEHFITRLNEEEMKGMDMIKAAIIKAVGQ